MTLENRADHPNRKVHRERWEDNPPVMTGEPINPEGPDRDFEPDDPRIGRREDRAYYGEPPRSFDRD